ERLVDVDAMAREHVAHYFFLVQLEAMVVAGGEQVTMHGSELLGHAIAHDHSSLQRDDAGVLARVVPHIGLALADMRLAEGEGHEANVPPGAGPQCGADVFMPLSRKRAA